MTKSLIPLPTGLDDIAESLLEPIPENPVIERSSNGQFITLKNIVCRTVDGKVFEQYDKIELATDVFRGTDNYPGKQIKQHFGFTPYQATVHSQNKGLFLPSMALSCNLVAALFQAAVRLESDGTYTTIDQNAKNILDQYRDYGAGHGWHAQNTVVDYRRQKIIHYPYDADFPSDGGTNSINLSRPRTELPFEKIKKNGLFSRDNVLRNQTLEDGLQDPLVSAFVKQITGLVDPSILMQIGQYFKKTARVWFPTNPVKAGDFAETRGAWLGCYDDNFNLDAYYHLNSGSAARGVRL